MQDSEATQQLLAVFISSFTVVMPYGKTQDSNKYYLVSCMAFAHFTKKLSCCINDNTTTINHLSIKFTRAADAMHMSASNRNIFRIL